ncbi:MAG TPA: ATP-binding protein [Gemmatimonadales bacterium]|nr:ATP-binding protein [Gemmatimonadales bacterium]
MKLSRAPLIAALVYAVVGVLWITFSDAAVVSVARDADALIQLQRWKGWLYVAATSVLVYGLVAASLRSEHRLARRLRLAEERLRLVLDTIPSRVLWKDRAGRYLGGNRRFAEDAGYQDPDDLVGRTDEEMPWAHDASRVRESDEAILSGRAERLDYEIVLPTRDGGQRHEVVTKVPLRSPDGEITGLLASYEDITGRKLAERQLRHAQKLRAIGELTSGVTHDFKNVLSVIIANAELLERALEADTEEGRTVADILSASRSAAGMVRKLLGFSRESDLTLAAVDLRGVVRNVAPMLSRLLAGRFRFDVEAGGDVPPVLADIDVVEQMLLNLITNARDAMPDGGEIRIRLVGPTSLWDAERGDAPPMHVIGLDTPPAPGRYIGLEVEDTGHGMAPEVAERIFEPFYTTKPTGQGTGLGLSMVYGLMRQLGGFVTLQTAEGEGATFGLWFPVLVGEAPAAARQRPSTAGSLPRGVETVLLVDDQEDLRRTGSRVLRRFGYTVLEAADGAEALAMLRRGSPRVDLVLTDYVMPGMDGIALVDAMHAEGMGIPVALTSGFAGLVEQHPGLPAIPKPWTMEELVRGVRRILDGAGAPPA